MADQLITLAGNLVAAPELRFTTSGRPVASFTVAVNHRYFSQAQNEYVDGDALFQQVVCWANLAENVAESLGKGDRVVITGRLVSRSYEDPKIEGVTRYVTDFRADEVAAALSRATAKVTRVKRDGRAAATADAWSAAATDLAAPVPADAGAPF